MLYIISALIGRFLKRRGVGTAKRMVVAFIIGLVWGLNRDRIDRFTKGIHDELMEGTLEEYPQAKSVTDGFVLAWKEGWNEH